MFERIKKITCGLFFVGLFIFGSMLTFDPEGKAALGEGTGHQRVVEILGYNVAESKVYFNHKEMPFKTKYLPVKDIQLFILNSEEVIKHQHIEKIQYEANPATFGNLQSITIKNRGSIKRDDILAVVIK